MKKLKDYLHLYLGCEFHTANSQGEINSETLHLILKHWEYYKNFRLILRPLADMTEDEAWEMIGGKGMYKTQSLKLTREGIDVWYEIDAGEEGVHSRGYECHWDALPAEKFRFLLSKGFDLFGLIESGIALDYKNIKDRAPQRSLHNLS